MNQIFHVILSLSISGSLIGLLILLIRSFTRRFTAKRWTFYLWLIMLVRLLVPIHADVNFMGWLSALPVETKNWQNNENGSQSAGSGEPVFDAAAENFSETEIDEGGHIENADAVSGTADVKQAEVDSDREENEDTGRMSESAEGSDRRADIFRISGMIWLLGVFLSIIYRIYTYQRFVRKTFADCVPVSDQRVWNRSGKIRMRLGISREIPLYESETVGCPMLIGLRKPYIVLPSKLLAEMAGRENDIGLILHHELIHYMRKDIWYKWLFQAALCIHWFNPVLYLFNRKFNADCELACDEAVLTLLTEEGRRIYGNVLLNAAEYSFTCFKNIPMMTLVEEKHTLKERLRSIAQYHKTGILTSLCALFVLAMLAVTAVLCGVAQVNADSGEVFVMRNDSPGFIDWIMGNIKDTSFTGPMVVNSRGNSYWMYDDDALIAGESDNDIWRAWNYYGGEKKANIGKFVLNGSDVLWIVYANKETTLELTSKFTLRDGRFKIVQVMPDQTVQVLNEGGEEISGKITLPEGRNCFKLVGQKARLVDFQASYSGENQKDIDGIFHSEAEEYAYRVKTGREPLDMARLDEIGVYLEAKEVSELYRCAWERDIVLSDDNWQNLFLYSDAELTSRYLLEALQDGKIKEFDSRMLVKIAHLMDGKTVSECFRYLLEQGKVSESDLENIFIYSNADLSGQYLIEALLKGKVSGLSGRFLSDMSVRVSSENLTDIVLALGKEDLTFENLRDSVFPYLGGEQNMQCVCHYIDLGNILTDFQLQEVKPYVSENNYYRIIEYNGKQK